MQSTTPPSRPFIATLPYDNFKLTGSPTVVRCNPPSEGIPVSHMILLLGPTGSGKSAFVEALAGKGANLGISKDQLEGVTHEIVCYRLDNVRRGCECLNHDDGHSVYVVDTPGFSDNKLSELKVFTMLLDWMKKHTIALDQQGLNTVIRSNPISRILYFHPITATRVSGSSKRLLQVLTELAVKDLETGTVKQQSKIPKISILTTMWDQVPPNSRSLEKVNTRYEQLMSPNGPFKSLVRNGSKVLKFENTQKSALTVSDSRTSGPVDHFQFLHLERTILRSQHIRDTPFGRPLYNMLCERIQVLVDERSNVQTMLENGNGSHAAHWANHKADVEARLEELQQEQRDFCPPGSTDDIDGFVPFNHLFDDPVGAKDAITAQKSHTQDSVLPEL